MKTFVHISAMLAFIVSGSITFAVVRWLDKGDPDLAFVIGAVVGTYTAAVAHRRTPAAGSSLGVKAGVGAALALSTILLGTVLHLVWRPFDSPEISIPIAVVGTFIFPVVVFSTMWNALSKRSDE